MSLLRQGTAIGAALVMVGACSSPGDPDATEPASGPTLVWRGCGTGESFQAGEAVKGEPECTYLPVPTNRADSAAGEQQLAVTRVRASGQRRGVLFVNPGGPGVTATTGVQDLVEAMPSALTAAFDVVAMDPRAVGESGYLSCVDPLARTMERPVDSSPDDEAERVGFDASIGRIGASCAQRQPSLIGHVGTQDFARDVDVLRATLGVERLNLLGYSYGTLLAYEYARLFPDRVQRMVLDGVVVPGESPFVAARARAESAEDALESFAVACADEGCPLGDESGKVLDTIDELQRALESKPVPVEGDPLTDAVDEGLFTSVLFGALYTPDYAFELAEAVPALREGDPAPFLELADAMAETDGGIASNVVEGAFWATSCQDRPRTKVTDAALSAILGASRSFGRLLAADAGMCQAWPVAAKPLTKAALPARTGAKAFIVSNAADPATPRSGADQVAALLPGSTHLRVDIWGHTATYAGLSCVDDAVSGFLLEGTTSPARHGCSAE